MQATKIYVEVVNYVHGFFSVLKKKTQFAEQPRQRILPTVQLNPLHTNEFHSQEHVHKSTMFVSSTELT